MALALGATVAELQHRMSAREFAEWQAFAAVYGPIGPERGDWHAAQIQATLLNVWRGKDQKPVKLADCVLRWGPPERKQTKEETAAFLELWLRMSGARKRE